MLNHLNSFEPILDTSIYDTKKQVVILGATGSIGSSTLEVINQNPDVFQILGLSAHSRMDHLAALIVRFKPVYVAVPNEDCAKQCLETVKQMYGLNKKNSSVKQNNRDLILPTILLGEQGLCELASLPMATHVVAGIVGSVGLSSCLAAANAGKTILLANKEVLVMAGDFFLKAVRNGGATLLPLDSEHNALFQCLPEGKGIVTPSVRSVWLTASGGPFLNHSIQNLYNVTVEEACTHPKWVMGRKISVDSATLMNKGLEVIEAAILYGLSGEHIKVAIHPQSTIHALVQYIDGSLLAHLSHPDMCVPIAHALAYNKKDIASRINSGVPDLDIQQLNSLHFLKPDTKRFPCLSLAYIALKNGQKACIALNSANEVAVEYFLSGTIPFIGIPYIVNSVLKKAIASHIPQPINWSNIYELDQLFRQWTLEAIAVFDIDRCDIEFLED